MSNESASLQRRGEGPVPARLLLVIDHDETGRQIAHLLSSHFAALSIDAAADRIEALVFAQLRDYDAAIIDLELANGTAPGLAIELRELRPHAGLILLTRIGQESVTGEDLALAGVRLVSMRELAAHLPPAVGAAIGRGSDR